MVASEIEIAPFPCSGCMSSKAKIEHLEFQNVLLVVFLNFENVYKWDLMGPKWDHATFLIKIGESKTPINLILRRCTRLKIRENCAIIRKK